MVLAIDSKKVCEIEKILYVTYFMFICIFQFFHKIINKFQVITHI